MPPPCLARRFAVLHEGMPAYEVKRILKQLYPNSYEQIAYLLVHGYNPEPPSDSAAS